MTVDEEYDEYRARLEAAPVRCGKCGGLTPPGYVTGGRCPRCLADEVRLNAEAVTREFDRLRSVEDEFRALMDRLRDSGGSLS